MREIISGIRIKCQKCSIWQWRAKNVPRDSLEDGYWQIVFTKANCTDWLFDTNISIVIEPLRKSGMQPD